MARPKRIFTEKEFTQFEKMCGIQCTEEEICNVLNITDKTLNRILKERYNKSFTECFKKFSATGKTSLRRMQFKLAEKSAAMAIFLGKQYLGQRDIPTEVADKKLELEKDKFEHQKVQDEIKNF